MRESKEKSRRETEVHWSALEEMSIITTDRGPFVCDVFWVFFEKDSVRVVPNDHEKIKELLRLAQLLPGFDNEAVIRAMGTTEIGEFVCWRRKWSN